MNTGRDLMKRLLHLLPVQTIKSEYNLVGNAEDVIDVVIGSQTQTSIKNFIFNNYALTRQNIYIYDLSRNFSKQVFNSSIFPFSVENPRTVQGEFVFHCLPKTQFNVYLSNPIASEELHFFHPVTVRIANRRLIIHFTKLVKNVSHYFAGNRMAKKANQINTEEDILRLILEFFANYTPTSTDINRGVKYLWDIDDVDSYRIQWRKSFSSATEVMDGTMTFKEKYPPEYQQIVQSPLVKTVFKYLLDDDYLCKQFTTDPENGQISINQFSDNLNQVNNVVSKILANN